MNNGAPLDKLSWIAWSTE